MVARDISVNAAILRPFIPLECNLTIASFLSPFNSLPCGAIYITSLLTFLFPLSMALEVTTYGADAKVQPRSVLSTRVISKSY